jgi:signal transduction histidine kinase
VAGAATAIAGALVFLGWALDVAPLRTLLAGSIVMLPNTSVGFILAGIALWLEGSDERTDPERPRAARVARACAAAVLVLGVISFLERVTGWHSGIDLILFSEQVSRYPFRPLGLMATNSTVTFTLGGAGLLLIDYETRGGWRPAELLATTGLVIATLALVGHLFGARPLYAIDQAAGMAVATAISFFMLHLGLLFARPTRGGVALLTGSDLGGVLVRRLLPATILVPLVLGWLWLRGRDQELFSREGGIAIFSLATMGVLVGFVIRSAHAVRALDLDRQAVLEREAAARTEAEQLAEVLQSQTVELEHQTEEAENAAVEAEEASERARRAAAEAAAARSVAEEASRVKGDFLAVMSHELRTPLNAILGYSDLLETGITGSVTDEQRRQLGRIKASASHLMGLIDEILTLSRVDAGKEAVRPEGVDVRKLLEDAAAMAAPMATAKGLQFRFLPPSRPLTLESDAGKLRQVLLNLLSNAIKFTEHGEVEMSANGEGDEVWFRVRDTGIGIAPEHLDQVFEDFWQIEQPTTRKASGSGLGLGVSRRLAELLGGTIEVESGVGEGSTFTLRVPQRWRAATPTA